MKREEGGLVHPPCDTRILVVGPYTTPTLSTSDPTGLTGRGNGKKGGGGGGGREAVYAVSSTPTRRSPASEPRGEAREGARTG